MRSRRQLIVKRQESLRENGPCRTHAPAAGFLTEPMRADPGSLSWQVSQHGVGLAHAGRGTEIYVGLKWPRRAGCAREPRGAARRREGLVAATKAELFERIGGDRRLVREALRHAEPGRRERLPG